MINLDIHQFTGGSIKPLQLVHHIETGTISYNRAMDHVVYTLNPGVNSGIIHYIDRDRIVLLSMCPEVVRGLVHAPDDGVAELNNHYSYAHTLTRRSELYDTVADYQFEQLVLLVSTYARAYPEIQGEQVQQRFNEMNAAQLS